MDLRTRTLRLGGLLVAVLTAALLLAACGGGGDEGGGGDGGTETTSPAATSSAPPAGETLSVTATEFKFDPATLSASADTDVTIEVVNSGTIEHDFTVDEVNVKIAVPATETSSATVSLPAGTYPFYCSVPGHKEAGMTGTLTVA
jgi:nitrite reductase (NO-forming)